MRKYADDAKKKWKKAGQDTNQGYADGINSNIGLISGLPKI